MLTKYCEIVTDVRKLKYTTVTKRILTTLWPSRKLSGITQVTWQRVSKKVTGPTEIKVAVVKQPVISNANSMQL